MTVEMMATTFAAHILHTKRHAVFARYIGHNRFPVDENTFKGHSRSSTITVFRRK